MIPPHGNAEFVAAMEQVLDVYRRRYDMDCPVVCMDETPRQLIGETHAPLPMVAVQAKRQDYEYRRVGHAIYFYGARTVDGQRHEPGYGAAHEDRLGEVSGSDCRALLQGEEAYAGDGQFEHASSGCIVRDLSTRSGEGLVGSV